MEIKTKRTLSVEIQYEDMYDTTQEILNICIYVVLTKTKCMDKIKCTLVFIFQLKRYGGGLLSFRLHGGSRLHFPHLKSPNVVC